MTYPERICIIAKLQRLLNNSLLKIQILTVSVLLTKKYSKKIKS